MTGGNVLGVDVCIDGFAVCIDRFAKLMMYALAAVRFSDKGAHCAYTGCTIEWWWWLFSAIRG
jgi:hypothetical protein